ncbi:MAG: ribokinase [Cyanobacteria bacterium P01_A01_bin.114]
MSILVLGSLNMDLVARVARLPKPGETLLGQSFETIPGGKGANQAVAAAKLGAPTQLIGRVGTDGFGETLRQALKTAGVTVDAVTPDRDTPSGVALIAVAQTGENQIMVVPGANHRVGQAELSALSAQLSGAQALLLQFEIPHETVAAAAKLAHQANVTVIVDPAPAGLPLSPDFCAHIDILTPNQVEASQLVGFEVCDRKSAAQAAQQLRQQGIGTVIVKLGSQGVVVDTLATCFDIPAFPVEVADTVAAGDAFNGGLAAALAEGQPIKDAVTFASAVAALSVTRPGAQPSMPTRSEVNQFLSQA